MKDATESGPRGRSPLSWPLSALALAMFASAAPQALAQDTPPFEETEQPEQAEPDEPVEQPEPPEQAEPEDTPEQAGAVEAAEPDSSTTVATAAAAPAPERSSISAAELDRGQTVQIGDAPDDQTALSLWRATGPRIGTYAVGSIAGRPVAIGADGAVRAVASGPVRRSGPVQRPPSRPPR